MKPIPSEAIDKAIEQLEQLDDQGYEARVVAFSEAQPVLFAWLQSDSFSLLTEDERGYLEYLSLIIWHSTNQNAPAGAPIDEDTIGEAEEHNYGLMESGAGKPFRDRLDPLFESYAQEDLLAFAEEALLEDEGEADSQLVTPEGREVLFVALKTTIDVLTA
jgi:hypothetical protein